MMDRKGKRYVNLDDPNIFGMRQTKDVEIMRRELSGILYQITKEKTRYIFNDSVTNIVERENDVIVDFKHGEHQTFDLVVAADGLF